ncbi:MAG: methyltransferase domain-containing protein [Spirochaetales bacterium]|nr:methyltransferase domain-containing protein [Spirochaetales bacterium]
MNLTIFPNSLPGNGKGHVKRAEQIQHDLSGYHTVRLVNQEEFQNNAYDNDGLLVFDQRETGERDFRLSKGKSAIALDEGGLFRDEMDYLVDTLPNLEKSQANVRAFHRCFDKRKAELRFPPEKILITFGGEDEKNLSSLLLDFFMDQGLDKKFSITLVQGPGFKRTQWPLGLRVLKNPENIDKEILASDLVFTHFGLSCFEALYQGVSVLLVNPSKYHEQLGRKAGLLSLGVNCIKKQCFFRLFNNPKKTLKRFSHQLANYLKTPELLSQILGNLRPEAINRCPLCDEHKNKAIGRFPNKTYFQCRNCALIYAIPFSRRENPYEESYFFDDYKKQYGKTYLEDFDNIKKNSFDRLKIMLGLMASDKKRGFLDIGCAYGPFLAAVNDSGHLAQGIEISSHAVDYVTRKLKLPCLCCDVEKDFPSFEQTFDGVSFWYVLEHFALLKSLLSNVNKCMKIGGILALGLPNSQGISMIKNKLAYLKAHPDDHFTLWKPGTIKKQLKLAGFRLRRIRITGHHGERFPVFGKIKAMGGILNQLSRFFGLGDTFEVYAEKERDI